MPLTVSVLRDSCRTNRLPLTPQHPVVPRSGRSTAGAGTQVSTAADPPATGLVPLAALARLGFAGWAGAVDGAGAKCSVRLAPPQYRNFPAGVGYHPAKSFSYRTSLIAHRRCCPSFPVGDLVGGSGLRSPFTEAIAVGLIVLCHVNPWRRVCKATLTLRASPVVGPPSHGNRAHGAGSARPRGRDNDGGVGGAVTLRVENAKQRRANAILKASPAPWVSATGHRRLRGRIIRGCGAEGAPRRWSP